MALTTGKILLILCSGRLEEGKYKADRYALVLSGHGDAFRGRTLMYDENPLGGLTIKGTKIQGDCQQTSCTGCSKCEIILRGITEVLQECQTYIQDGSAVRKFDILGFDNCSMNMLEIGYQFREFADILLSSEGFIPKSGWDYEMPLKHLVHFPTNTQPEYLSTKFVEAFRDLHYDFTPAGRSVELSGL